MLTLYFDHNMPRQIASGLRLRGIDVLTAYEDQRHHVPDDLLLSRVAELGRTIVTKDSDFLVMASRFHSTEQTFPGIIYLTDERIPVGRYIRELELVAKTYSTDEIANSILYLPL
jgi:predicted nuclease of predicted toxin-antitoxin system